MSIAKVVATRSDCERDQVGAVVVKDNRIRATGYNGAPAGNPGCESCPRRVGGTPPGSDYESGAGLCHAIHAEANALLYCNREDLPGATLYVTRSPCTGCSKLIAAVGITDVVYPGSEDPPKRDWGGDPSKWVIEQSSFQSQWCLFPPRNGEISRHATFEQAVQTMIDCTKARP